MASVRIWFKRQLRIDHLSVSQTAMFKISTVGVVAVKNRVTAGMGPEDSAAKPLSKRYAIQKSRRNLGNRRNLTFTGAMLANLQVRTVSENRARAGLSTQKDRIKAWANQKIQPWLVFSPRNKAAILETTRRVFDEIRRRLVVERRLGGGQR